VAEGAKDGSSSIFTAFVTRLANGSLLAEPCSFITPNLSVSSACDATYARPIDEAPTANPALLMPNAGLLAPRKVPIASLAWSGPVPVCLNPKDGADEVDVPPGTHPRLAHDFSISCGVRP
jgi:hypothetical protein